MKYLVWQQKDYNLFSEILEEISHKREKAPSDEGAVSAADWGKDR